MSVSSPNSTWSRALSSACITIVTAPFDFPGGRRFHFMDPSGNELAV